MNKKKLQIAKDCKIFAHTILYIYKQNKRFFYHLLQKKHFCEKQILRCFSIKYALTKHDVTTSNFPFLFALFIV